MAKWISLERSVFLLRIALGVTFIWFGALKLSGSNPVFDIVYASYPMLAEGIGNTILGIFEVVIGLGLMFEFFPVLTHIALAGHLLGTMLVFVLGPEVVFDPHFPFLTLAGEFVFKNVVLLMAGFVILKYNEQHRNK